MEINRNYLSLMKNHGFECIGSAQRTIAYTVISGANAGYLTITAAAHGLKKGQSFRIATGTNHLGVYKVAKVISVNQILAVGTFVATSAGNIILDSARDGFGFVVDAAATVSAFVSDDHSGIDDATVIAQPHPVGKILMVGFKKLTLSAGSVTVIKKPMQAEVTYTP